MGVVFESVFKTLFVSEGENQALASQRKVEQATKAMVAATEKAAGSQKKAGTAAGVATAAHGKLEKSLKDLVAVQQRQQREQLESAEAARKQASAADLSTREGRKLAREQLSVAAAHDRSAKAAGQAADQLQKQDAAQDATAASSDRLSTSMRRTETSFDRAKSAARRMFMTLGAGYAAWRGIRKITEETVEFDRSMRNVNSIAQMTPRHLAKVNDQVLRMSGKVAQAPKTLAEGLYDLVSSGFEGADAMKVLRASAKAATAGLTTTETSTATVAAVLNAYHQNATQARDVSDVLFRTVDRGVVSFEELSGTIGDVLPFAASLGVNLREVGAATATMTKAGIGPAETMTRLKNTMVSMLKPGTDLTAAIESLGFESGEALIKQKGFQGALDALIGTTDGTKSSVAELFPNIRALGGVLALTGANSKAAAGDLKGMADASGAADQAFQEQMKSVGLKWDRLKAQISTLSIEVGQKAIPVVSRFLDVLSDDKLTNSEKLTRLSAQISRVIEQAATRLPKLVEGAAPAVAEAGGKLGVALVEGMVKGFTKMDVLGKLFTAAAVIRLVGGPGALLAAGRAIGARMGVGVGQGMAASTVGGTGIGAAMGGAAMAGKGRLGQLAAGGGALAKTAGKIGGWGLALTAGMEVADEMVNRSADNALDRLEQIDQRGRGVRGTVGRLLGPLNRSFTDSSGTLSAQGDRAHRLKQVLEEINTVGRARAAQLRGEGEELLNNLNLTEKQRQAIQATLNAPARATRQNRADQGIMELRFGEITRARDIQKVVNRTQANIDAGWSKGSEGWRRKTAQAMNAQVKAIRAGMDRSVIATDRGRARIAQVLRERKLTTGDDPMGIARGFAKSWRRVHEITPKQLQRINRDLAKMPKDAREKAIDSMEALAQGLVRKGKLPERELTKLTSSLRARFGRTGKQAFEGLTKGASGAFDLLKKIVPSTFRDVKAKAAAGYRELTRASVDGGKRAQKPIQSLADQVARAAKRMQRSITEIPGPMRSAYTIMAGDANTASAAFGSSKRVSLGFRRGGVTRFAAGGMVPAAVSSGELLRYPDGSWVTVPGPRTAADNVLTALPVRTEVFTDHGQSLLAAGATRREALTAQLPHFADGGKVRHPKLTGGSSAGRSAGQAGIDSAYRAAVAWVKKQSTAGEGVGSFDGRKVARWIIPILTWARKSGWGGSVSSGFRSYAEQAALWANRASNPFPVARPGTSNHEGSKYPRGAVDVSDYTGLIPLVDDRHGPAPGKLKWFGPGDAIHFSGTGHRRGGIIRFVTGGKVVTQAAPILLKAGFNHRAAAGVLGNAWAESTWNPAAMEPGTDNGGLFGFTTSPVSRQDLVRYAASKRKPWTDVGTQIKFMLSHGQPVGRAMAGSMNDSNSIPKATELFMRGWERPSAERLPERIKGAFMASRIMRDLKLGKPGKPKKSKVTDDLTGFSAKQARRMMPRFLSGHNRGAFSSAMEAARLTGEIRKGAITNALVKVTRGRRGGILGFRTGSGGIRPPRKDPKFGSGAYAASVIGGIGAGTGRELNRLFTAGNRENAEVKAALEGLGDLLAKAGRFSVDALLRLQRQARAAIKRTIDPKGPGGRAVTKAEEALIRRARSVIDLAQGTLGAKAGGFLRRSDRIGRRAEQRQFERGLTLRRRGIDPSSVAGIDFERQSGQIQLAADKNRKSQLRKALQIAKKAGDQKAISRITGQLKEVSNAIAEGAVSILEKTREAISARFDEGLAKLERIFSHQDLWDRALEASQKLRGIVDSPEAMLEKADMAKNRVGFLEQKRDEASAAAAAFAKKGMMDEARRAIDTWHEAVVELAEATAEQVELRRAAALGAAARATDRAASGTATANTLFERFELEQRLAGTYESGAFARRDFILAQIIPALNAELSAMESQLAVIVENGDDEQVRQQRQANEEKRNEILRAQLEAQEQIAENTDPRSIGGALAFQFGGETLTDQLILSGNGV